MITVTLNGVDLILPRALNAAQERIVGFPIESAVKVVAGAGTGKTTVLAARFAYLCKRCGLDASRDIVALTFGRKAQLEMEERVHALLALNGIEARLGLRVSTYHAFCQKLLADHPYEARVAPGFILLGEDDGAALIDRVGADLRAGLVTDADGEAIRPERLLAVGRNRARDATDDVLAVMLKARSLGLEPGEIRETAGAGLKALLESLRARDLAGLADEALGQAASATEIASLADAAYGHYVKLMRIEGALDFDGLIIEALHLMGRSPETLTAAGRSIRESFQVLLVDEFQDTSGLELRLARLLAGAEDGSLQRIMVVGDRKQAIYEWRNARIENLDDLIPAEPVPWAETAELTENYRSSERIVRAANQAASRVQVRDPALVARAEEGPTLVSLRMGDTSLAIDEQRQAAYGEVARMVRGMGEERGAAYADMAVLLRANHMFAPLAREFDALNVPYLRVGGVGFFEQSMARDMVSALAAIRNPRDSIALARLLLRPPLRLTHRELFLLALGTDGELGECDEDLRPRARPLLERLLQVTAAPERSGPAAELAARRLDELAAFLATLLRLQAESRRLSVRALISRSAEDLGLLDSAAREDLASWDFVRDTLIGVAESLAHGGTEPSLGDLLTSLRRAESQATPRLPAPDFGAQDGVRVLTAHKAKGLEFDAVFLMGIGGTGSRRHGAEFDERWGVIPAGSKLPLAQAVAAVREGAPNEEDRLWYVGLTRAKRRLVVHHFERKSAKPKEPPEHLKDLDPAEPFDEPPQCDTPDPSRRPEVPLFPAEPHPARAAAPVRVRLRATDLGLLAQCPARWWMATRWGVEPPSRPGGGDGREVGNAVHAAALHILTGRDPGDLDPEPAAAKRVQALREWLPREEIPAECEVDLTLEVPTEGGLAIVRGAADWLRKTPDGVRVVDFKTDDPRKSGRELTYALQLVCYARALREAGVEVAGAPQLLRVSTDGVEEIALPYPAAEAKLDALCALAVRLEEAGAIPDRPENAPCAECWRRWACPWT